MTSPWSPGNGRQGHSTTEQMAPRPGSMGAGWIPWGSTSSYRAGLVVGSALERAGPFPSCGTLTPAVPLPPAKHPAGLS